MTDHNVIITDLPPAIAAFTKATGDYYTIVLNARLTAARRAAAYRHELAHIRRNDFDDPAPADTIERRAHWQR